MSVEVIHGDSREVLRGMAAERFDSCVTDPPYALVQKSRNGSAQPGDMTTSYGRSGPSKARRGFMGQEWDTGETAFDPAFWAEVLRVLKPGAHLLACGGTRTYHRLATAIEDAGFEIRDCVQWLYGSGFPKSHDVSKAIDRAAGAEREVVGRKPTLHRGVAADHEYGFSPTGEIDITAPATDAARQWSGWGTALKPACEIICMARKPLGEKTVAANVLRHGTGAINVDGCRVPTDDKLGGGMVSMGRPKASYGWDRPWMHDPAITERKKGESADKVAHAESLGRWPANVIHDGSEEVVAGFPDTGASPPIGSMGGGSNKHSIYGDFAGQRHENGFGDSGSAARFFYTAKADAADRLGSKHPTVKPVDLMAYLCRLVTPPGGTVLDPFAGSGTTGMAAMREGFNAVLIEREEKFVADIRRRLDHVQGLDAPLFAEPLPADWKAQDAKANYQTALEFMQHKDDKP